MNITRFRTTRSAEQDEALDLMLAGENVFLTGEAGTGKTTILRDFRNQCDPQHVVFLAPTAIAATNIKGQTIHSFCRLKPGLQSPNTIDKINNSHYRMLLNAVQTIVIDEISMVRSDVFAAIDHRFREAATGYNQYQPFAGKQIIVCGDFFQLPPVTSTEAEESYLQSCLGGEYPFQTPLWDHTNFHTVMLKNVHRQGDDQLFMQILRNIRHGEVNLRNLQLPDMSSPVNSLVALNKLCLQETEKAETHQRIALCTTRKEAEEVNRRHASKLTTQTEVFKAQITGTFLEKEYPTEANLCLQPGARVMTLMNKRNPDGSYEYVNGDLGVVTEIISESDGQSVVLVEFDDGRFSVIEPAKWPAYKYELETDRNTGKGMLKLVEVGSFIQIPLRLAWAITIHKAQGMGFDRVKLFLGNGCFANGQLYTALSRCRSLDGLQLKRRVFKEDVLSNETVVNFYKQLEQNELTYG